MPLGMHVGRGTGDFVLYGDPAPDPQKGGGAPKLSAHFFLAKRLDASRCYLLIVMAVGLSLGDFVLDGDPASLPKRGTEPPNFRPMFIVAAGWIKMALGTEVGLSPGDFVLDETQSPVPIKGTEPRSQFFGPLMLWPNRWMHQDATWYGGRP